MASVKSTVSKKVGGGLKKLSKGSDWLGFIGGYAMTVNAAATSWGAEFLPGFLDMHMNAVTRHNIGAVLDTPARMGDPNWNPALLGGIVAAIGGWAAKMLPNIVPHQSTIGSIVSKAGVGMVIGSTAAIVVSELAQGSSPFDKAGTTSGGRTGPTKSATTSGLIGYPRKFLASYPSSNKEVWAQPRD